MTESNGSPLIIWLSVVEMSQFLKLRIRMLYLFGGCNENPILKAYSADIILLTKWYLKDSYSQ